MGYTVYITMRKSQRDFLQKIFDLPEIRSSSLFDPGLPVFNGQGLAYCDRRHKEGPVFGMNYGSNMEFCHALVALISGLIGKDEYIYDGNEILPNKEAFWWRKKRCQMSAISRVSLLALGGKIKEMELLFKLISQRFGELSPRKKIKKPAASDE